MIQSANSGYSIRDIINYRLLNWSKSEEFLVITKVPAQFEPFLIRPDYYCFGMITEGQLDIEINDKCYNLSPSSLMVYRPGQAFKVLTIADGTTGVFVLFTRKFLNYLYENIFTVKQDSFLSYGMPSLINLSVKDRGNLLHQFQDIFSMLEHLPKWNWELAARNLVSVLIYQTDYILNGYVHLPIHTTIAEGQNILVNKFTHLVSIHFRSDKKLSFYASRLFISEDHLYSVVKRITGKSPTTIINQEIIREAQSLIKNTDKQIAEIAYSLNFSDPYSFSKYFKKHTGSSPSRYRKEPAPG